jgi:hypothetical protein
MLAAIAFLAVGFALGFAVWLRGAVLDEIAAVVADECQACTRSNGEKISLIRCQIDQPLELHQVDSQQRVLIGRHIVPRSNCFAEGLERVAPESPAVCYSVNSATCQRCKTEQGSRTGTEFNELCWIDRFTGADRQTIPLSQVQPEEASWRSSECIGDQSDK